MNTGAKIAIISTVAVIAIITGVFASYIIGNVDSKREQCASMSDKINQDRTGLMASLGINTHAINQEIDEYNAQCANNPTHFADNST